MIDRKDANLPAVSNEEAEIAHRRDEAVRRALNTPPKPYKEAKVGKQKPKTSSASGKR